MQDGTSDREALAARIRHEHRHGDPRRRALAWVVGIIVVAVVAVVGVTVAQLLPSGEDPDAIATPQHATEAHGFLLAPPDAAATPVAVTLYEDFLCESCRAFHAESGTYLAEQVAAGAISVEYRPIVFLVSATTDEYAQRAANAAVCVADAAGVPAYVTMHGLLLAEQPAHGGPGLSDERLLELAAQAGATGIEDCVADRTFEPWLDAAIDEALAADVSVTPTVRIGDVNVVRLSDGRETVPGPAELQYAIDAAAVAG